MTMIEDSKIKIDFNDWESLIELMDSHEKYPYTLFGTNADNEDMFIGINKDTIKTETLQTNGWTRVNIYHRDCRIEELYERT